MAITAAQKRMLDTLDKKYATPTEKHIAEFNDDIRKIDQLLKDKVIDNDHADIYRTRVKVRLMEAEAKIKEHKDKIAKMAAENEPSPIPFWNRMIAWR